MGGGACVRDSVRVYYISMYVCIYMVNIHPAESPNNLIKVNFTTGFADLVSPSFTSVGEIM